MELAIHLRILIRLIMAWFLEISGDLTDQFLESDGIVLGICALASAGRQPLEHPLSGSGIGQGGNLGGNLGGLAWDGWRPEHRREPAIERRIDQVVHQQARQEGSRNSQSRAQPEPPARGRGGIGQLLPYGGQYPATQLGSRAAGRQLVEEAFDVLVHSHSFTG